MIQKHRVQLSQTERQELIKLTKKGKISARKLRRAQILLLTDAGHKDEEIATMLHLGVATVERTRKKFVEGGLDLALNERPRPGAVKKLDRKAEEFLIATASSKPPPGKDCWTTQLLAEKLVQLQLVESISAETVRLLLKRRALNGDSKHKE
jgi:transposase